MVGIAIDPINPNKVYISTNAINEPGVSVLGRVFRTMNGGISWADISGDLPNIPLISIAVARDHSLKNPLIFVGGIPVYLFQMKDRIKLVKFIGQNMVNYLK